MTFPNTLRRHQLLSMKGWMKCWLLHCHTTTFLYCIPPANTHPHVSAEASLICCCWALHCPETLNDARADVFSCSWHPFILGHNRWLWTAGFCLHLCVRRETVLCTVLEMAAPLRTRHSPATSSRQSWSMGAGSGHSFARRRDTPWQHVSYVDKTRGLVSENLKWVLRPHRWTSELVKTENRPCYSVIWITKGEHKPLF